MTVFHTEAASPDTPFGLQWSAVEGQDAQASHAGAACSTRITYCAPNAYAPNIREIQLS